MLAAGGRLRVSPAWRWQRTRDDFPPPPPPYPTAPVHPGGVLERDDVSPSLGAVWEAVPARLFVEGHLARTVRIPTWTELFGLRGGIVGNPRLVPETVESVDAAVSYRPSSSLHIRLAAFVEPEAGRPAGRCRSEQDRHEEKNAANFCTHGYLFSPLNTVMIFSYHACRQQAIYRLHISQSGFPTEPEGGLTPKSACNPPLSIRIQWASLPPGGSSISGQRGSE